MTVPPFRPDLTGFAPTGSRPTHAGQTHAGLTPLDEARLPTPVIYGLAGEGLTPDEADFFREANPLGYILFTRNCRTVAQLQALTASLCDLAGRRVPILIDQEGGRVQRLRAPFCPSYPAAQKVAAEGAAALAAQTQAMGADLHAVGVSVNCAPVLDVLFPETHEAIGDRAYGHDPDDVADCADIVCRAYLAQGIVPVLKHMPGLGRADLDTHTDLPTVGAARTALEAVDFRPYELILAKDYAPALWGMIGHALYAALDAENPASASAYIIENIIRKQIGFDGLLLSDDLSMAALAGYGAEDSRAVRVLAAGCDIALHCNGKLPEMKVVANRIPGMTKATYMRYNRSVSLVSEMSNDERRAV